MKSIDVTGICNGLVDIFADISHEDFQPLGYEKGTMRLVEVDEQRELLGRFAGQSPAMCSGGSVANSMIVVAQLGGKSAICCNLADDHYGRFYRDECLELGIEMPVELAKHGATGTVVSLITPDAERTMRTSLGVCRELAPVHIPRQVIKDSHWVFIEGYVFSNSDAGRDTVAEVVTIAKETGTRIALTCSDAWIVSGFGEHLHKALESTSLVFANEEESAALAGTGDVVSAGRKLKERFPYVVLTAGPRGAFIWWEGQELQVPAFTCEPRDLTGAGDTFAGAFLHGVNRGLSPYDAAHRANFLASKVISQVGARLRGDVRGLWDAKAGA
jgi:sugar/nucleoside kinase (ribokinase family)